MSWLDYVLAVYVTAGTSIVLGLLIAIVAELLLGRG